MTAVPRPTKDPGAHRTCTRSRSPCGPGVYGLELIGVRVEVKGLGYWWLSCSCGYGSNATWASAVVPVTVANSLRQKH